MLREGYEVVQIHPVHGARLLIRADGHGQTVYVGETDAGLVLLDVWHVMGDKDANLAVLDPDTLAPRSHAWLQDFEIAPHYAGLRSMWDLPRG